MAICCVFNCTSSSNTQKFSKFSFPRDPELRKKWAEVIPLKSNILINNLHVCEKHFAETDLIRYWQSGNNDTMVYKIPYKIPKLQKNAVPSIFPGSQYCKETQKRKLSTLQLDFTVSKKKLKTDNNNKNNKETHMIIISYL